MLQSNGVNRSTIESHAAALPRAAARTKSLIDSSSATVRTPSRIPARMSPRVRRGGARRRLAAKSGSMLSQHRGPACARDTWPAEILPTDVRFVLRRGVYHAARCPLLFIDDRREPSAQLRRSPRGSGVRGLGTDASFVAQGSAAEGPCGEQAATQQAVRTAAGPGIEHAGQMSTAKGTRGLAATPEAARYSAARPWAGASCVASRLCWVSAPANTSPPPPVASMFAHFAASAG